MQTEKHDADDDSKNNQTDEQTAPHAEVPIKNVPKTTTLIYISPEKTGPGPLSISSAGRAAREKGERRRRHGWEDSGP